MIKKKGYKRYNGKEIEDFFFKKIEELENDELIEMVIEYSDLFNRAILGEIPKEMDINIKDTEDYLLKLKAELLKRLGANGMDNYKRSNYIS